MPRARVVDFAGATAVVTGRASAIGKGIATVPAEEGSNVVPADRDEPALEAAAELLPLADDRHAALRAGAGPTSSSPAPGVP